SPRSSRCRARRFPKSCGRTPYLKPFSLIVKSIGRCTLGGPIISHVLHSGACEAVAPRLGNPDVPGVLSSGAGLGGGSKGVSDRRSGSLSESGRGKGGSPGPARRDG